MRKPCTRPPCASGCSTRRGRCQTRHSSWTVTARQLKWRRCLASRRTTPRARLRPRHRAGRPCTLPTSALAMRPRWRRCMMSSTHRFARGSIIGWNKRNLRRRTSRSRLRNSAGQRRRRACCRGRQLGSQLKEESASFLKKSKKHLLTGSWAFVTPKPMTQSCKIVLLLFVHKT